MSDGARWFGGLSSAALIAIILAFVLVEHRTRNPEWRAFQEKGIALAAERLRQELSEGPSPERRSSILAELAALEKRKPEIMEIRPFGGKGEPERCLTCHFGIEDLSPSHPNSVFGCVSCHGGNGSDLTVRGAHLGIRGGRNPARLDLAGVSCGGTRAGAGACHTNREDPLLNRADHAPRSIMATNAGILGILRFQWGVEDESRARYGIRAVSDGTTSLTAVPPETAPGGEVSLADSHFRKFCASCHLWSPRHQDGVGRLEGCPACHAPYRPDGFYRGGDPTIRRDEPGHAATHSITNRIPDERCTACHNRSARIGLNYRGRMESEQYGTPYVRGALNDETLGDDRFFQRLVPDVHYEKGMGCIDCHTGQDTMGDGTVHAFMKDQVEIRCEDCHGGYTHPPSTAVVEKHDPLIRTLLKSIPNLKVSPGDVILKTSKGRPMPHTKLTDKGFRLTSKLTGKEHPVSIITGKKNGHTIKGHERLECDTCHSAWSPQCYGCHQVLDFRHEGKDHLTGKTTPGRWAEGRSFFRFERNIYGINSRGRVGILVPGCQVWNTVIDKQGKPVSSYDSRVMRLRNGLTSMAMGPTHPHTTRTEVPRCVDCHLDPKALGLGEGALHRGADGTLSAVRTLYDSLAGGLKIPFAIDSVINVRGEVLQGTSHTLSRGFNSQELGKIVAIARCLPCHDRYDDPVWERPGPYKETPRCLEALARMKADPASPGSTPPKGLSPMSRHH